MDCEHNELLLKRFQTENGVMKWYECKKCHKMFTIKEVQAL